MLSARSARRDVTVATNTPDPASVVRALSDAAVQFVVVGEIGAVQPLRIVVSRHPTNLDALARALDRLDSVVRTPVEGAPERHRSTGGARDGGPQRVGDPMGTISVTTSAGDVDLLFGGARRSLYAEVAVGAEERVLDGLRVQWTAEIAVVDPPPRATSRMLGRRLLSLADVLSHRMDRRGDRADGEPADRERPDV